MSKILLFNHHQSIARIKPRELCMTESVMYVERSNDRGYIMDANGWYLVDQRTANGRVETNEDVARMISSRKIYKIIIGNTLTSANEVVENAGRFVCNLFRAIWFAGGCLTDRANRQTHWQNLKQQGLFMAYNLKNIGYHLVRAIPLGIGYGLTVYILDPIGRWVNLDRHAMVQPIDNAVVQQS